MHSTTLRTLTLAALIAGAAATPAAADSIAYIERGNVHLTTPDGATSVAVTSAGGYSSVSQADDGRMIALHGQRLHLLSRWGDVLADFSPVADGTAGSITLSGPFDPAISPDGSKVAYGFYVQYKSGDPTCGKPGGCQVGQLYTGTGYAKADGPVDWSTDGYRPQYSWTDPSWIDDTRTLLSSPTSALVKQSAIDVAGASADATEWFSEGAVGTVMDGELSRQEQAVAFVGNTQGDHLLVYRLGTKPADGGLPQACLDAPAGGKAWSSPSWSPDGQRLAFAGKEGIYVAELPGIGAACPDAAKVTVDAFRPGATSPDWGPADLPGPRPTTPPAGAADRPDGSIQPVTAASGGSGPTAAGNGGRGAVTLSKASLKSLRSRGLTATVPCTGSGTVKVSVSAGKRAIGSGKATCSGGTARVKVKLSAAGRKRLARVSTARLTLTSRGLPPLTVTLR